MENKILLMVAFGFGIAIPGCTAIEKYVGAKVEIAAMENGYVRKQIDGYGVGWFKP